MYIQLIFGNNERRFADKALRLLSRIIPNATVNYESGKETNTYTIQGGPKAK